MSRFYIERILIQGENKPDAIIELHNGVNFIIGPSNTGKSLVMDAIDYVFGQSPTSKHPFRFDPSFGYTEFSIDFRTKNGKVTLKRSTLTLKTKVTVTSTDPGITSGVYAVKGEPLLNDVYLKLMGISEPHDVWSSSDGRKNKFTWRNILHMFFIKQTDVSRESSILLNPSAMYGTNDTSVMYSILFMLNAEDADAGSNPDTAAKKKARREAVRDYIQQNIARLQKRVEEIREKIQAENITDINAATVTITGQLDEIEKQLTDAIERSKELIHKLFAGNSKLSEYNVMKNRFSELREQYLSDIERLTFVVDGERVRAQQPIHKKCPFCDGDIIVDHKPKYINAVRSDLAHIQTHLSSLDVTSTDLDQKICELKQQLEAMEFEKATLEQQINIDLRPRFAELKTKLSDYREYVRLTREVEIVEEEERRYSTDLLTRELAKDTSSKDHNYKTDFEVKDIQELESILIRILQHSGFAGYSAARLNMDTIDLEIAGHQKSTTNGGGYCSVLNTIMALAMMEFLLDEGEYPPGLLCVDSALSQLSESDKKKPGETIKAKFIDYVLNHNRDGQILIIEHKEKVPMDAIEKSNAHVIEFSGSETNGDRYGLLPNITNNVDDRKG